MFILFVAIEMDIRTGTDIRTVCLIIKFFGESFGIICGVIGIICQGQKMTKTWNVYGKALLPW